MVAAGFAGRGEQDGVAGVAARGVRERAGEAVQDPPDLLGGEDSGGGDAVGEQGVEVVEVVDVGDLGQVEGVLPAA